MIGSAYCDAVNLRPLPYPANPPAHCRGQMHLAETRPNDTVAASRSLRRVSLHLAQAVVQYLSTRDDTVAAEFLDVNRTVAEELHLPATAGSGEEDHDGVWSNAFQVEWHPVG